MLTLFQNGKLYWNSLHVAVGAMSIDFGDVLASSIQWLQYNSINWYKKSIMVYISLAIFSSLGKKVS